MGALVTGVQTCALPIAFPLKGREHEAGILPPVLMHMPQLVGVAHDIDGDDLARFDLQRRGLELAVGLAGDEARQAVDQAGLDQRRAIFGKQRSEEHTSELQSLMRISYAVFCLKKKKKK